MSEKDGGPATNGWPIPLDRDMALLDDIAELDELIGWFASQYRYATHEREVLLATRKRLSPDQVRANLLLMRELKRLDDALIAELAK